MPSERPPILAQNGDRGGNYFRAPRCGFFNLVWRRLALVRFGLLMLKVPLPKYSALYNLSSANQISSLTTILF